MTGRPQQRPLHAARNYGPRAKKRIIFGISPSLFPRHQSQFPLS